MRLLSLVAIAGATLCAALPPTPTPESESTDIVRISDLVLEDKYFDESPKHAHYDARFYKYALPEPAQRDALRVLIQTYLSTARSLGIQTWLMHGSLLGWWWGKKIMPWDLDADVQVSEADMFFMAAYHNMSTWYYRVYHEGESTPSGGGGKAFLLDVNPNFKNRGTDDLLNVIDARWIDTETGLFIDITAARYNVGDEHGEGMLYDKNSHEYRDTYLYPLIPTTFEGVPALIPFDYKKMLISEYGERALENTRFHEHIFDEEQMQWNSMEFGLDEDDDTT